MDDKQAARLLAAMSEKYPLTPAEKEALAAAIGVLSWTALAGERIKKMGKTAREKRERETKW